MVNDDSLRAAVTPALDPLNRAGACAVPTRLDSSAAVLPVAALRLQVGEHPLDREEWVANEVPVALEYNGVSHAVMLATPLDMEDFALGFSLSEGLIDSRADLLDIEQESRSGGLVLQLRITARCEMRLKERRRNLSGRTGCGLCGTDSLDQVLRPLTRPVAEVLVSATALARAMHELAGQQPLQQRSGGLHAAAWCGLDGAVRWVREDVGRHNALDKVLGALARQGGDPADGFCAVTSRASVEMVQKTAQAGVGLLATVSAPTALAVRLAADSGLVLAGFVRGDRATVYSHSGRVLPA